MVEAVTPSLLAALEQCKDLQTKLTSTISTLEDHNDFLTDKCVQSSEHNIALKSENVQQQDAIVSLSAENILLRQKVHALQEFKEKFEEIRKEVASLRRNNMQLESNQKSLHFQNIEYDIVRSFVFVFISYLNSRAVVGRMVARTEPTTRAPRCLSGPGQVHPREQVSGPLLEPRATPKRKISIARSPAMRTLDSGPLSAHSSYL
jgi:hypothetical protein